MAYDFHYTPTGTGVISGKEVLEQTEDAINDLGNTAISGVQEALDKAEQALTNSANAVDDAQTALNTANNAEGVAIQAQTDVGNLSGTVTNIGNRVTTAEGNITNLQGRMTTAESNIGNLQGRMTTAETNIGNLQTAVSTAQATANSAQQTATTARQQSYVFRYSSTALVASSTNSNTLLDNTDNLKVGDKVIDSDGVLFSITAIDTANSTFTVGSALADLALDANVVHTSGNETVGGEKTFNDLQIIGYGTQYKGARTAYILPEFSAGYSGLAITTLSFAQTLKIGNFVLDANNKPSLDASKGYIQIATGENNGVNACTLEARNSTSSSLGTSANRWSKIYGTEYYYGSNNVEFSTKFVTTDTAQTITGVKTFSSTPVIYNSDANGSVQNLYFRNQLVTKGDTSTAGSQLIRFSDSVDKMLSRIQASKVSNGNTTLNLRTDTVDTNNNDITTEIQIISGRDGSKSLSPQNDNAIDLGRTLAKWKNLYINQINDLTPSSLSLPNVNTSSFVDISGYFTNTGNGDINTYSVTANGWVYLRLTDIGGCQLSVLDSSNNRLYGSTSSGNLEQLCLPVTAGTVVETQWTTSTSVTVAIARFIPCQGNI